MFVPGLRAALAALMMLTLLVLTGCGSDSVTSVPGADTASSSDVNGSQAAKICEPGKFFCSGKTAFTCNADGTAYEEKTCPAGCLGGTCNDCQPGEKTCDSATTLKTCKADGSGFDVQVCAGKCENNACVEVEVPVDPPAPDDPVCTAGEVTCLEDGTLATCMADETGYEITECDFACDTEKNECVNPACEKGAVRCNDEADKEKELLKCNETQSGWELSTECTQLCEAGECKTPDGCEPESAFCDGNDIKKCSADGSSTEVVDTCSMGCNEVSASGPACNLCTEATVKCLDESSVGLCADASLGFTEIAKCSDGQMCASGKCVSGLAWSEGVVNHDALLTFTRFSAKCWLDGKALGESIPCMAMDTTNLPQPFNAKDLKDWWCANQPDDDVENPNEITSADFPTTGGYDSENLYNASSDLHGSCSWVGGILLNNQEYDFKVDDGTIQVGQALGVYCMEYDRGYEIPFTNTVLAGEELWVVDCEN